MTEELTTSEERFFVDQIWLPTRSGRWRTTMQPSPVRGKHETALLLSLQRNAHRIEQTLRCATLRLGAQAINGSCPLSLGPLRFI